MTTRIRELLMDEERTLGWLEPHTPAVTRRRLYPKTVYFAILPTGQRTEFTFPSRRQAVLWLLDAAKEQITVTR